MHLGMPILIIVGYQNLFPLPLIPSARNLFNHAILLVAFDHSLANLVFMPFVSAVLQVQFSALSSPLPSPSSQHPHHTLPPSSSFPHGGRPLYRQLAAAAGMKHFSLDCSAVTTEMMLMPAGRGRRRGRKPRRKEKKGRREKRGSKGGRGGEDQWEAVRWRRESYSEWERVAEAEMARDSGAHASALCGGEETMLVALEGIAAHVFASQGFDPELLDATGRGFASYIPGSSSARTRTQVEELSAWQECVGREGRWVRNDEPRRLAWFMGEDWCKRQQEEGGGNGSAVAAVADAVTRQWTAYAAAHRNESGTKAYEEAKVKAAASWKVRESLRYEWEVPTGTCGAWERFDPQLLCPLAKKKGEREGEVEGEGEGVVEGEVGGHSFNLLFIGDSMQAQLFQSVAANILKAAGADWRHASLVTTPQECDTERGSNSSSSSSSSSAATPSIYCMLNRMRHESICANNVTISAMYLRNNHLLLSNHHGSDPSIKPWSRMHSFLRWADVIVLNRGAHYMPDSGFRAGVRAAVRYIRNLEPDKLIIMRSTPPGHVYCNNYSEPIAEPQDPDSLPHHWGEFARQNKILREEAEAVGAVFMDVNPMTVLRPDGHLGPPIDCLHYCIPGPLDVWAQLLLNWILKLS